MKCQVVWGALAVIAIIALSATGARAGGGGVPSPLTSFFVCNAISGNATGPVVDVESPVFGPDRQGVKIGNATLACAFARLFQGGAEINPNPSLNEQLKCYSVSLPKATGGTPPTRYNTDDELVGTDSVKSTNIQFICAPASFTQ
jgi:hypothetical protein